MAFLTLNGLKAGDARELTPHEVKQIRALGDWQLEKKFIKMSQLYFSFPLYLCCKML